MGAEVAVGLGVAVGGREVAVGCGVSPGARVGGTAVAVGGTAVFVGAAVGRVVAVGSELQAAAINANASTITPMRTFQDFITDLQSI